MNIFSKTLIPLCLAAGMLVSSLLGTLVHGHFFYRQSNGEILTGELLLQDIRQLTARADELLMSAPDEPCFGFLCTGK